MGHFVGIEQRSFYVEEDGTYWDSPAKKNQYDPETLEIMGAEHFQGPPLDTVAYPDEGGVDEELHAERRTEIGNMKWGAIRKLHKKVTGRDERNMKKHELITDIIRQENS